MPSVEGITLSAANFCTLASSPSYCWVAARFGVTVGVGVRVGVNVTVGVKVGARVFVAVGETAMVGVAAGAFAPQADKTMHSIMATNKTVLDDWLFMVFSLANGLNKASIAFPKRQFNTINCQLPPIWAEVFKAAMG